MANTIHKIALILKEDPRILKDFLILAAHLEIEMTEQIILDSDIRKGTVNYYSWINKLLEGWVSRGGRKTVGDLRVVLNSMNCRNAAEILKKEFPSGEPLIASSPKKVICERIWKVLNPIINFEGREDEIQEIDNFIADKKRNLLVISGMGGQGKTQLCRQWIKIQRMKDDCPMIVWLAGEGGQTLSTSISNFGEQNGNKIDESPKDFEQVIEDVIGMVKNENQIIWIIDNVDSEYEEFGTFAITIFNELMDSKIIVTSRIRTILPEKAICLTLKSLAPKSAEKLIRENISGGESLLTEEINELCEEMGYHALALQLSIGYINNKRTTSFGGMKFGITNFLELYRKEKAVVLDLKEKLSGYDKTLIHHLRMAMTLLKERNETKAFQIMNAISLFRHDGIEVEFLVDMFCTKSEINLLEEALSVLHSLSLVQADKRLITVHPLIQEATRFEYSEWKLVIPTVLKDLGVIWLDTRKINHIYRMYETIIKDDDLLNKHVGGLYYIYTGLSQNYQFQTLLFFADKQRKRIARFYKNSEINENVMAAELFYGKALVGLGKYHDGLSQLQSVQNTAQNHLADMNALRLEIEISVGETLLELGRSKEAVMVFENLVPRYNSLYGEANEKTMTLKVKLSNALARCDRTSEALKHTNDFFEWGKQFGDSLPNELERNLGKAIGYFHNGDWVRAKYGFQRFLELSKEEFGEEHGIKFPVQGMLATVYLELKDYQAAFDVYEDLIKNLKEILRPNHPDTFPHMNNQAICLYNLGKPAEAIEELENVLKFEIQFYRPEHTLVKATKTLLTRIKNKMLKNKITNSLRNTGGKPTAESGVSNGDGLKDLCDILD